MSFNKLLFLLILLIFIFNYKGNAYGAVTINHSSTQPSSQKVDNEKCADAPYLTCWNDEVIGSSACGTGCTQGQTSTWTKYDFEACFADPDTPGEFIAWLPREANSCSTGDKYTETNPPVLRPGFCSCADSPTPYKTCCSVSTGRAVNARGFAVDPYAPLEADCNGAFLCGQTSGDTKVVCCGGVGQPPCGDAACAIPATPTPPIGCNTDAVSAVGCEVGCAINPANGKLEKCHIYNRDLQNVCNTKCVAGGPWNCVPDLSCSSPGGGGATPTPTPCSGPNCCFSPGATRLDCRPANQCSL